MRNKGKNKGTYKTKIKIAIIIPTIFLAILSALIFSGGRVTGPDGATPSDIAVEFTTAVIDPDGNITQGHIAAGREVRLTFRLTENKTGKPLSGLNPEISFYIPGEHDEKREHEHADGYHFTNEVNLAKVQLFVLNSERGTIEVLDAFGNYDPRPEAIKSMGTMTSKVIRLRGSPQLKIGDMVAGRYGDYIYATLPAENQVAVVNTISREAVKYIDVGAMPGNMFLQPQSKFLWVSNDGGDSVSIIDTASNTLTETVDTGKGRHQIAFSPQNAYVTNSQQDTVSVIRLEDHKKTGDIKVGKTPDGIAYSGTGGHIYVTNNLSGTVAVIDEATRNIKKYILLNTGIGTIEFTPDGKRGVVLNKLAGIACVIDAGTDSLIKTVKTGEAPDAIGFMEEYALVRNTYSPDVTYISMTNPEISNNEPVGTEPPLTGNPHSIVITPYGDVAAITSPRDGMVYFIHEMNDQPMAMSSTRVEFGSDSAAIVENKLHETGPGTYQQYIILDREGPYIIEFKTQKINASFKIDVLPAPITGPQATALFNNMIFKPGVPSTLQYLIKDGTTGNPEENLTDLIYVVVKPADNRGAWIKRLTSKYTGNGTYEATIIFPEEGDYVITLSSSTLSSRGYKTSYDYVTVRNSTIR